MSDAAKARGSTDVRLSDDSEATNMMDDTTRQLVVEDQLSATLPEIPTATLDFNPSEIIGPTVDEREDRVKKRASNILKLTEENEKLKAELKAITDRLEAAERRREELARKEQRIIEDRSR